MEDRRDEQRTLHLLVRRLRVGLFLVLSSAILFLLLDLRVNPNDIGPLAFLRLSLAAVLAAVLWLLRHPRSTRQVQWPTIAAATLMLSVVGAVSHITRDSITPLTLAALIPIAAATLLPWALAAQGTLVLLAAVATTAHLMTVQDPLDARLLYPLGALVVVWTASILIAIELSRVRRAVERYNRERRRAEADRAALLQVMRDVTGTLDLTELLDRVQTRAIDLLACDRVVTIYWDPDRAGFRVIGQHGMPADQARAAAGMVFRPRPALAAEMRAGRTVTLESAEGQEWIPPETLEQFEVSRLIMTPLVVRGILLGAFLAVRIPGRPAFRATQVQLMEGIAHHVAIAMGVAERYGAQQEEAEVAAALARVGREMIRSLSTSVLLQRLCSITTEVLGCEQSCTWMVEPQSDAFVPGACQSRVPGAAPPAGPPPRVTRTALAGLIERLDREEVVQIASADAAALLPTELRRTDPPSSHLFVPLRRGSELIGIHTAAHGGESHRFTVRQQRIARGVAQVASLALENARLVEELEQANRIKSDFVATMSHELRTPLNVITGYNDLLLEGEFGALAPAQTEILQRIGKNAWELLELINATLSLSRLETGQLAPEVCETDLHELIARIDAEIRHQYDRPGLEFRWEIAPHLRPLHTDPMKLKVILKNLVGNALKFTDEGSVRVRVEPVGDGVQIEVQDTGIGIAPEMSPIIFEPFRQVEASIDRRFGGVGLGLHIVQRFLTLLGGTIELESEPGKGSTFRVWVPDMSEGRKAADRIPGAVRAAMS